MRQRTTRSLLAGLGLAEFSLCQRSHVAAGVKVPQSLLLQAVEVIA